MQKKHCREKFFFTVISLSLFSVIRYTLDFNDAESSSTLNEKNVYHEAYTSGIFAPIFLLNVFK